MTRYFLRFTLLFLIACDAPPSSIPQDDDEGAEEDIKADEIALAREGKVRVVSIDPGALLTRVVVTDSGGRFVRELTAAGGGVPSFEIKAARGNSVTAVHRRNDRATYITLLDVAPGDTLRVSIWNQDNVYLEPLSPPTGTVSYVVHAPEWADSVDVSCAVMRRNWLLGGGIVRGTLDIGPECLDEAGKLTLVAKIWEGDNASWMWKTGVVPGSTVELDVPPIGALPVSAAVDYPRSIEIDGGNHPLQVSGRIWPLVGGLRWAEAEFTRPAPRTSTAEIPMGLGDMVAVTMSAWASFHGALYVERAYPVEETRTFDFHGVDGMLPKGPRTVKVLEDGAVEASWTLANSSARVDGFISTVRWARAETDLAWLVVSPHPWFLVPAIPGVESHDGSPSVSVRAYEGSPWRTYAGFRRNATSRPATGHVVRSAFDRL